MEVWRPVVGFAGFYEVSDAGRVRSLDRVVNTWRGTNGKRRIKGRVLSPGTDRFGRKHVELWVHGEPTTAHVHTLVAEAFLGPRPEGCVVRHLNDISGDNRAENLAYGTQIDNARDALRNGCIPLGSSRPNAKLTEATVREIRGRAGERPADLAREYGVSDSVIRNVLARKAWRHVA